MGLRDLFRRRKSADDKQDAASRFWLDLIEGNKTTSGVTVSPDSAMKQSAVWACVRVKQEDIGKLPCILYRRLGDGKGKVRATDHPLYDLIGSRPNRRDTAFDFKAFMQGQLDTRGNALAIKEFDGRGKVAGLWPQPWANVDLLASTDGEELFYRVRLRDGTQVTIPAEGVLHLKGMSLDGLIGLSPIAYHRETIGLALAAEKYGASFFGNSARPSGVLKVKQVLGKEAVEALRVGWKEKFQGPDRANQMVVLDGEMDWQQIGMDNADAQYVETRTQSNQDIYRIYRMPPHKVGDLDKATFSNIEQQALEYVTDCLLSEMVRWEQTLRRDLLTEDERKEYFFEFLPDALLRGDLKSRYEAYAIGRNWGWLTVNDILDRENMNRVENGDIRLQPLNMIEAGTAPPVSAGGAKALLALATILVGQEDAKE
jgi:HK97 family phage portal protein